MYHRFSTLGNPGGGGAIEGDTLRAQLQLVRQYHACWTPSDHWRILQGQGCWEPCPVVITVDDGYRDFFTIAFPLLQDGRVPAMVFLTTGFVDGQLMLWWDRLEQLLEEASGRRVDVTLDGVALQLDLTSTSSRKQVWHRLADRCRFLPHAEKEQLIEALAKALGAGPALLGDERYAPLCWEEIQLMSRAGILFGAHTLSHPILSRLPAVQAQTEIEQSRHQLETMLGVSVDWFSYPQGGPADYTPKIKEMVRAAGFKGCYVAHQDVALAQDLFALPRYCPSGDMVEFRWLLCGAEYLILKLRALLGKPAKPGQAYWAGSDSLAPKECKES